MSFSGNWFDITFVVIVLVLAILAFLRGFIKDFAAFLNWIIAIAATYFLTPQIAKFFDKSKYSDIVINSATSAILFIIILIIISMITSRISSAISEKIPNSVNQSLGFAFGFAKGYFLCSLFFSITIAVYSSGIIYADEYIKPRAGKRVGPDFLVKAQSYKILEVGADILKPITNLIMESVSKAGLADGKTTKDKILEKLDEVEQNENIMEDHTDYESDQVTSGKGYNLKEIKKMNRLIDTLNTKD